MLYSDPIEIQKYVNGYKHIVKTINGFDSQIEKFSDNLGELDELIRIVSTVFYRLLTHICDLFFYSDQLAGGRSSDKRHRQTQA